MSSSPKEKFADTWKTRSREYASLKGQQRSESLIGKEIGSSFNIYRCGCESESGGYGCGKGNECLKKVEERLYAGAERLMRADRVRAYEQKRETTCRGENGEYWGRREWREVKIGGEWIGEDEEEVVRKRGKEKKVPERRAVTEYYHRWCY